MRNGNSSSKAVKLWYPIKLPLSYEGEKGSSLQGDGRTLAISSAAVRFACDRSFLVGEVVRLSIQWPARLSDGASLSLWATGKIRRSGRCELEVAIERHEFRTRREGASMSSIVFNAAARTAR
jgi:hypothetical protein